MKIRSLVFACVLHKLERSITPLTNRLLASFLAAAALLVLSPSNASAVPLSYQVGIGSTVALYTEAPGAPSQDQMGLGLAYQLLVTPFSFTLNDNGIQDFDETGIDQFSFDFFEIWTTEEIAEADEFIHKNITATLDLTSLGQPVIAGSAPLNGTFLNGTAIPMTQTIRWQGNAVWDNPAPSFVATDRTFIVDLSDVTFNATVGHVQEGPVVNGGEEGAAVVRATITQTASSVPSVPDTGSTAVLLGMALLVLLFTSRKLSPLNRPN